MFEVSKKAKETIGLDIGSCSIKVVSIVRKAEKNLLFKAYNIKKIPYEGGKPAKTAKLIKETLDEVDIRAGEVNLAISGSNVIVRFITLPRMSKDQLESAMSFEAEKYIPFNVNEVILDFHILDDAEGGQMNVLLAAAKKEFVQTQMEMFEKLGIGINVIDVNAFAVFNAGTSSGSFPEDKGTVFLDMGYLQTNMLIATGSIPRFMRVIQIGGRDIAIGLGNELGVTEVEGEAVKCKNEAADKEKIKLATDVVLEELVKEIQLSFSYFENKSNKPIGAVYCSGGLVYQEGVIAYLQEKLAKQVKLWNPIGTMEISPSLSREAIDPIASQLSVSVGLALRD